MGHKEVTKRKRQIVDEDIVIVLLPPEEGKEKWTVILQSQPGYERSIHCHFTMGYELSDAELVRMSRDIVRASAKED